MKLNKLCLNRANQKILDELTAEWPGSGVVVLLGANGAGKSTLLNMIAGTEVPDSGSIELTYKTTKFIMPEPARFYPHLTVREQLLVVSGLCQQKYDTEQIDTLLEHWQLTSVSDKLTQHLSLGFRQRLSLAQLEASQAGVLLLDEPMNGMDPEIMRVFKEKVLQWKQDKLLIMATHVLHEAQQLADWVVVMERGRIIMSEAYQPGMVFHEIYQQAIDNHHQKLAMETINE